MFQSLLAGMAAPNSPNREFILPFSCIQLKQPISTADSVYSTLKNDIIMTLKTIVEHDSTEFEIDLDTLDHYGNYYVDEERGLIINASVYTNGTPDSRHLRGDVVCGSDYTLESIDVDQKKVRESIRDDLHVEISDETLETAIAEYQAAGIEAVGAFNETLDRYRILSRATS